MTLVSIHPFSMESESDLLKNDGFFLRIHQPSIGGYVQQLAQTVECFRAEIEQVKAQSVEECVALERCLADEASEISEERCVFLQYTN
jgi:hypothetical protein